MKRPDRSTVVLMPLAIAYLQPGETVRVAWEGEPLCACGATSGSAHDHFGRLT